MNVLRTAFLIVMVAGAAPVPALASESLQRIQCRGEGHEYDAVLAGRLSLVRAFTDPAHTDDENAREAVLHQVKYVWGYIRNNPVLQRELQVVLSARSPVIESLAVTAGTYGDAFVVDWKETAPHLAIEDVYTQRAIARGSTRADDPALVVEYRVRFPLALCGGPRPASSTLRIPLPKDPWLMYWHVPRAQHRPMRYFQKTAVTNPCSDDDFADLPHPIYYWYDWHPVRFGPDDAGRPFDCRNLLREGTHYFPHAVTLERTASASGDFSALRKQLRAVPGPLDATLIFGVQDHLWKDLDMDALARGLGGTGPMHARASALLHGPGEIERGYRKMLLLIADLPRVMNETSSRIAVEKGYLHVTVEGTLRTSGRPIRVLLVHGLTDVFGPTPPQHWEAARRALTRGHIVTYVGHSGIGENLKLAQIEKQLGLAHEAFQREVAGAPYQLVAFISCYSYMYFGLDLVAAGAGGRDFVYTGTGYSEGDRGTLMVLDLVDQLLASDAAPVIHHVRGDDFFVFKSFRP